MTKLPKPFLLLILDGWGINRNTDDNAITSANTPVMDRLCNEYPCTKVKTSGTAVGLPEGQMGNSEVGHLNIGAGRVVHQELTRISLAIKDGSFFKNKILLSAIENVKKTNSSLHLFGLVSDGGVHSHNTHLYALLKMTKQHNLKKVFIHAFLDGRDVSPKSAKKYLTELEDKIKEIEVGKVATVSGRYYAMDRDKRWERTKKAYDAIVHRIGESANSPDEVVEKSYTEDTDDEFVLPTIIDYKNFNNDSMKLSNNDSVIFFNFRPDRPRQLTETLINSNFNGFDRGKRFPLPYFVTYTEYNKNFNIPVAFKTEKIKNTLSEVLSARGLTQLHIAETEKYAHVTFFFNGGREKPVKGEDRILVPSPKVATYDLKPEMSAFEVADKVTEAIESKKYDFIVLNFANTDMVGHSGKIEAAVKAAEAVDRCIGKVVDALQSTGGECIITADHGNSEQMREDDGKPYTAHTTNMAPFIYIANTKIKLRSEGKLADIAPTILKILKIEKPREMTGQSLL